VRTKEYERINFDQGGRFYLSKAERIQFGEKVIITRDGNYLRFFTQREWKRLVRKQLAGFKGAELRRKKRGLFGSAFLEKIDSQGRVHIPVSLRGGAR